jgi:hypothetical protein
MLPPTTGMPDFAIVAAHALSRNDQSSIASTLSEIRVFTSVVEVAGLAASSSSMILILCPSTPPVELM